MEMWIYGVIAALSAAVIILAGKLFVLRHSVREAAEELGEKMAADTNTLISISSGDRTIRRLAAEINTQLRALRDERRRLKTGDEELKSAVTNISHDLRTPLTAISGYLDLLEQEEMSENVSRYISVIRERTEALKTLTEELFRYSVITSAIDSMQKEEVCLNEAIEIGLSAYYGALAERCISPEIKLTDRKIIRRLDSTALHRIFSNILNNAVKYSDGDLSVTLDDDGVITFSNAAKNLSTVDAERLFDRFYTVESARYSTGLGLSIAKLLAEKMGGTIKASYSDGRLSIVLSFTGGE